MYALGVDERLETLRALAEKTIKSETVYVVDFSAVCADLFTVATCGMCG